MMVMMMVVMIVRWIVMVIVFNLDFDLSDLSRRWWHGDTCRISLRQRSVWWGRWWVLSWHLLIHTWLRWHVAYWDWMTNHMWRRRLMLETWLRWVARLSIGSWHSWLRWLRGKLWVLNQGLVVIVCLGVFVLHFTMQIL